MGVEIRCGGCAQKDIVMNQLLAEEHIEIEGVLIAQDRRLLTMTCLSNIILVLKK